jgi:hypothetical protein
MVDTQINIKIEVDLAALGQKLQKAIGEALKQLTVQAYEEWQNEAGKKLKTTRRRYQDALHYTVKSDTESEIVLYAKDKKTNWIVTALERGVGSYSIRDAALKKAKLQTNRTMSDKQRRAMFAYLAKVGRLGLPPTPFVDIPFRSKGSLEQGDPNAWRRISKNTKTGSWKHPGFKPVGSGGPGPLRPAIVEYIKKTAGEVFGPILARLSA